MSGRSVFEQMMQEVMTLSEPPYSYNNFRITEEQFKEWEKVASFDIMKGLRYGQSFCNYFGITDNILYYEFSWLNAEEYIKRAYIK